MTPVTDLGARPASAGGASTTLTIITVYVPSNAVFSPDIIVQRSPNTTRLTTEFNSGLSLVDNRLFAPIVSITSAERRAEGQPSGSNASLRESAIRSLEARLTSSSAVTTEADEAVKAAEHALSQRSANSPTLGLLSFVSAVATDPSASVRSDDEGRLDERPSGQSAAGGSRGDEDGMIELSSADVLRQKRKAAASDSLARASSSPRLQRLAELPLLRDIQSLFSDLARLADENLRTASIDQQTSYVDESDDGMVELLAADVGSLMLPTASPTADAQSIAAARAMTLDAGLAIYQAFEIAQPDSATSDAPTDATPQVDVPAAEQLARVE
jgi:hypothetical protein